MRFNHAKYAEYYHRQMIEAGYPGMLLPFVVERLKGVSTVLDVGSGTGFFAIPLAGAGFSVTAVEPSAEMAKVMDEHIGMSIRPFIRTCTVPWEEWSGMFHDALISVHSLYPMSDPEKSIALMNRAAVRKIIIIRNQDGMRTLSGIVRERLGIISGRDLNAEVSQILDRYASQWEMVNIHEERKRFVADIHKEAESLLYQLKLGSERFDEVDGIVRAELDNEGGSEYFKAVYSDNAYIFT